MVIPVWVALWQQNFTSVRSLLDFCNIQPADRNHILAHSSFPINVPKRIAEKMEKGNYNDPLFRQFVPFIHEEQHTEGFAEDPLHEAQAQCTKKLLNKYKGRALVITTPACGMHCRFCFRRHYPYTRENISFEEEVAWLSSHQEIDEVILSGGDPLALSTSQIEALCTALNSIPHIKRLRIHTRFPIGIPERIDQELLLCLKKCKQQLFIVLHVNHPKEIDDDVRSAASQLLCQKIPLLSQTVLLRGVNDSVETMASLMETLGNAGIIPYYLHQLDRVEGAAHFEVPVGEGLRLVEGLRNRLSGFLVPRFVQEVAGEDSKKPITQKDFLS
jgi:EF-P beta-lysylation protein EpmB